MWNGEGLLAGPTTAVAVAVDGILQRDFALGKNFPNPFNATTLICYQLPATTSVSLVVYNSAGQLVRHLDAGYEQAWAFIYSVGTDALRVGPTRPAVPISVDRESV